MTISTNNSIHKLKYSQNSLLILTNLKEREKTISKFAFKTTDFENNSYL